MNDNIKLYLGDCLEVMRGLEDECVDSVVTSPPYWALRTYLPDKVQLRNNLTLEEIEYVEKELLKLRL